MGGTLMLELRIAKHCALGGALLEGLLRERGLIGDPIKGVVCWGSGYAGELPALNAACSKLNKLEQLRAHSFAGVTTVPLVEGGMQQLPILGRRLSHTGGRDIVVHNSYKAAFAAVDAGQADYLTVLVPSKTEYRVWSYRGRHLRTYEKVLKYEDLFRRSQRRHRFGRSARNGYAFELRPGGVPEATALAHGAVASLNLDFGAVDVLAGEDGKYYVLEVNTAPGVEGPRECITALAGKIAKWVELGMPRRNGAKEAA
jgi:hypothetical protein